MGPFIKQLCIITNFCLLTSVQLNDRLVNIYGTHYIAFHNSYSHQVRESHSVPSMVACVLRCSKMKWCLSVNFERGKSESGFHTCDLNYATSGFVQREGFVVYSHLQVGLTPHNIHFVLFYLIMSNLLIKTSVNN